jgi:hypothetical protein
VTIENGGFLNMGASQEVQIGIGAVANNNSITVTGAGSKWTVANTLKVGSATSTGNVATVTSGAILQVQTATPAVTIGAGAGNVVNFSNSTLAYKGVSSTSVNLLDGNTGVTGVGLFTWTGINTFRMDTSTETGGTNYTFANNLGVKNYTGLELLGITTMARAITLDGSNGGTLLLSGATATVTGGVTLTGTVNVTATGTTSSLTGVITGGGALTKSGTATLTLASTPSYSGNTTVSVGTLKLNSANASNESSTVTIASTGAALELGFSGTDTVAALVIGISPMPSGVYKSNTNITDPGTAIDQIIGTGTLTVGAGGGSNYASWANDPTKGNIPGAPPSGDFDNDGLTNLMEYALGKDPKVSNQPAGVLLGNVITFTKGTDAIANGDVNFIIETSTDLGVVDLWTAAVTHNAPNASTIISYTFTPGTPIKEFARLKVTQL